jgi:hypothetical protein
MKTGCGVFTGLISNESKLGPPVPGSFENNAGYFFTKDRFNEKKFW